MSFGLQEPVYPGPGHQRRNKCQGFQMDRAERRSPASADSHLDASPQPRPQARGQAKGSSKELFVHLSSTKTCWGGAQARPPYPPPPLRCHSNSPLGCLPEKGGEKEKEIKRGNGENKTRGDGPSSACGLAAGKGVRLPLTPTPCLGHRMPSCVLLCQASETSSHPHITHHLGGPVGPNSHKGNIGM